MGIENGITEEAKKNAIDLLITIVVDELSESMGLRPAEVLPSFLSSRTGKLLYDEEYRLWWSGPSDLAEMYRNEMSESSYYSRPMSLS